MRDLQSIQARRCFTVSGWLLKENKVLFVKHKMLGIWLAPGGHVDENELPHQAAEREFLEETGIKVRVISALPVFPSYTTQHLPVPFLYNLHWINKPGEHKKRSNGQECEQHYIFGFFVVCVDKCMIKLGDEGIDDIRWFTQEELKNVETSQDIRAEANHVFSHYPKQEEYI